MKFSWWRNRKQQELDEEIQSHLRMATHNRIERGEPATQAEESVRREMGNTTLIRDVTHDQWGWSWIESLMYDVRLASRSLARRPGFALVVALTLGLGIGATLLMFGVLDTLVFRAPEGIHDAARIKRIYLKVENPGRGMYTSSALSFPAYTDLRDQSRSLDSIAAYFATPMSYSQGADARPIRGAFVSSSYFAVFGVMPEMGTLFSSRDDIPGNGGGVVVLSDVFWRRELGADPGVIGREVWIAGQPRTIIGIAARGFAGGDIAPLDVWLPISSPPASFPGPMGLTERNMSWVRIMAKLRSGVSPQQAESELTLALQSRSAEQHGKAAKGSIVVGPLQAARGPNISDMSKVSFWLFGVSALLLLIVAANVINLFLSRILQQNREYAVRQALGAGRGRLVSYVLLESVLLSLLGGVFAILFVVWAAPLVRTFLISGAPAASPWLSILNWHSAVFLLGSVFLIAFVSGFMPAIQSGDPRLLADLRGAGSTSTFRASRARNFIAVGQIALTFVLLAGAGLFLRTLRTLTSIDTGMETQKVLLATIDLKAAGFKDADVNLLYEQMMEKVRTVPGVESTALSVPVPFMSQFGMNIAVPGKDLEKIFQGYTNPSPVIGDIFSTLGIKIIHGRPLTSADRNGTDPVVVINRTMAERVWPGEDPLGKCVVLGAGKQCTTVVGVAQDSRVMDLIEEPIIEVWMPLLQLQHEDFPTPVQAMLIRTSGAPENLVSTVRQAMQSVNSSLPYINVRPFSTLTDRTLLPSRVAANVFSLFGVLALGIAMIGLYGLVAYQVRQRTREIGLRMALGAQPGSIVRLVLKEAAMLAIFGIGIGLAAALGLSRLTASLLYGVTAKDPATFAGVAILLALIALAAGCIPARRAMRVDPMVALRYE